MNKKILLAISFLFSALNIFAQFNKGDKMVGANLVGTTFSSGNTDYSFPGSTAGFEAKSNSFSVSINPSYGWFIKNNTAVGVLLNTGFGSSKISNIQSGTTYSQNESSQFTFGLGGFVRNYFKSKSETMLPFVQANVNFGTGSGNNDGFNFASDVVGAYKDTYDGKSTGVAYLNATLSAGLTKMLNKNTGLDFYAGYTYSYNKKTSKTTTVRTYTGGGQGFTAVYEPTERFTSHGFTLGVGFQIFLNSKKK